MKATLLAAICILMSCLFYGQEVIPVSGGNAMGAGSVSYTVGQLMVATNTANNGSVAQGIQQSIELFTLVNPTLKTLTLKAVMFPNPTKDKIILSLTDNTLTALSYKIYDVGGRVVKKGKVNQENTSIAMKYAASEVYILKVAQNNKQLKVFKIIKN